MKAQKQDPKNNGEWKVLVSEILLGNCNLQTLASYHVISPSLLVVAVVVVAVTNVRQTEYGLLTWCPRLVAKRCSKAQTWSAGAWSFSIVIWYIYICVCVCTYIYCYVVLCDVICYCEMCSPKPQKKNTTGIFLRHGTVGQVASHNEMGGDWAQPQILVVKSFSPHSLLKKLQPKNNKYFGFTPRRNMFQNIPLWSDDFMMVSSQRINQTLGPTCGTMDGMAMPTPDRPQREHPNSPWQPGEWFFNTGEW